MIISSPLETNRLKKQKKTSNEPQCKHKAYLRCERERVSWEQRSSETTCRRVRTQTDALPNERSNELVTGYDPETSSSTKISDTATWSSALSDQYAL